MTTSKPKNRPPVPEAFVERMSCQAREMLAEPAVKRLAVILRECALAPDEEA